MKKAQSVIKIKKLPVGLQAELDEWSDRVAQQERNGNLDTYDHSKLARLEKVAAAHNKQDDEVK